MIEMLEEDPTHGTAVAGGFLSMPISASSALAVGTLEAGSIHGMSTDVRRLMPFWSPQLTQRQR